MTQLEDKSKGCLVGLACGDYLGSPVEFSFDRSDVVGFFGSEKLRPLMPTDDSNVRRIPGYYTDDACMAMCLAESLIENGFDVKDQFVKYRQWLFESRNVPIPGHSSMGIGKHIFYALTNYDENSLPNELIHQESQGGNGALMKCAPVGLKYYRDFDQLKDYTVRSTIITHNSSDAVWSCLVQNFFIAYSLLGFNKDEFVERFLVDLPDCPAKIKDVITANYLAMPRKAKMENSAYTLHSLKIVLYSFFRTGNFEEAVTEAVFMGGDADTQGAIIGALAGAYYGYNVIPMSWKENLLNRGRLEELSLGLITELECAELRG